MPRIMCLLIAVLPLLSNGQAYLFDTWNSNNGLDVSDVNAIVEDPKGYLWLATEGGGLKQFDGISFESFNQSDGLPSDFVSTLAWDGKNRLCVGTEKGLCFFDGTRFVLDSALGNYKQRVIDLAFLRDTLFVGFRHKLMFYHQEQLQEYGPAGYFKNQVLRSLTAEKGKLIVSCDSGIVEAPNFRTKDKRPSSLYFSSDDYIFQFLKTHSEVWTLDNGRVLLVDTLKVTADVKDVLVWKNQGLVYTSGEEITILAKGDGIKRVGIKQGLNIGRVKCLFEDRFGNLWLGGYMGLAKWVNPNIENYNAATGLEDESVHAIYTQKDKTWFGTNSGIEMLDGRGCHRFDEVSAGVVFKIVEDPFGILWFATESGLISFDGTTFKTYGKDYGLDESFVFDITQTQEEQLVVATSASIYLQNDYGFESLFLENPSGAKAVKQDRLNNRLWFNPLAGNLAFWKDGLVTAVDSIGDFSLSEIRISNFDIGEKGELWIGSLESGLYFWDGSLLVQFTENEGLLSNKIVGVKAISASRVWVLFDEGMQSLNFENGVWSVGKYYDKGHGFLGNRGYTNSMFWDADKQQIWAGTQTGAVAILEEQEANSAIDFFPELRNIDLFFNPTSWDTQEKEPWTGLPKSLKLEYNENYLTFHFGAISSGNPKDLYYRYKLKGQDEDWILANNRFEAIYTNIAHGDFTFQLQVSDKSNFLNVAQTDFSLKISAPFYKTFWFWALIVVFFSSLTGWAVRTRLNQINEKRKLRMALAESERKALRLQMNPHFIFNALDSISGFIFKNEPKLAVRYLNSFAKLMRSTLELSRKKLVPLYSELSLVKNYLLLEQVRFNSSFDFEIEVDQDIDEYVVMIPPMVIQPNLENAILHGLRHKEGKGRLMLRFKLDGDELLCEIRDDGVGRKKAMEKKAEKQRMHKGLSSNITKERMSLLSQSMERSFLYEIEDLIDENGKPSGTKVLLTFPLIEDDGFDE